MQELEVSLNFIKKKSHKERKSDLWDKLQEAIIHDY